VSAEPENPAADAAPGKPGADAAPKKPPAKDVDDLWAMMNKPVKRARAGLKPTMKRDPALDAILGIQAATPKTRAGGGGGVRSGAGVDPMLAGWLDGGGPGNKVTVPAKIVRLEELNVGAKDGCEADMGTSGKGQKKAVMTGLEGVLGAIRGERAPNVLDRTRETWAGFKEGDAEVAEELDAYKKDKNRYTDKIAFLERTDRREWEADMDRKKRG
jgi:Bucentaur or craniofacial development